MACKQKGSSELKYVETTYGKEEVSNLHWCPCEGVYKGKSKWLGRTIRIKEEEYVSSRPE